MPWYWRLRSLRNLLSKRGPEKSCILIAKRWGSTFSHVEFFFTIIDMISFQTRFRNENKTPMVTKYLNETGLYSGLILAVYQKT